MSWVLLSNFLENSEAEENAVSKFLESMADVLYNITTESFVDTAISTSFESSFNGLTLRATKLYSPIMAGVYDLPPESIAEINNDAGANLTSAKMFSMFTYVSDFSDPNDVIQFDQYIVAGDDGNIYVDDKSVVFEIKNPATGQSVGLLSGNVEEMPFTVKFLAKGELASLTPVTAEVTVVPGSNGD